MSRNLLLWTTRTPTHRASTRLEFVRFFRLDRWLTYLIGVPVFVAVTLLAIFFFAAFLGLFAAVLAIAALRVWWLRAKLRRASGRAATINDFRSIEMEMSKTRNQRTDTRKL